MLVFSSILFLLAGEKYFHYFFTTDHRYFFVSYKDFNDVDIFSIDKLFGLSNTHNNLLIETLNIGILNSIVDIMNIILYPTLIIPFIGLIKYSYLLGLLLKFEFKHINILNNNLWIAISGLAETFIEVAFTIILLALATRAAISVIFRYREDVKTPRIRLFFRHLISLFKIYILYIPITFLLALWEAFISISY